MDYKSSIEHLNEVNKKLLVSVPSSLVEDSVRTSLSNVTNQAQIKGFRPGKAPKDLIEKMHGKAVRQDTIERLISNSLEKALQEHKLTVVGNPAVDIEASEPGQDLRYSANVFIYPNPEIGGYDKISVKVPKSDAKDKDIERVIDNIRDSYATVRKLEFRDKAQLGDILDTTVSIKAESDKDWQSEPLVFELGKGKLPQEIETALVGMSIGEVRELKYPAESSEAAKSSEAKPVTFRVSLSNISEKILPEVDDNWVQSINVWNAKTVLELRMEVRKRLEEELEKSTKARTEEAIINELLKSNSFMVPQIMVDEEIMRMLVRYGSIDPNKVDFSKLPMDEYRTQLGEAALSRVRAAILVDRIAEREKLIASREDLDKSIAEISAANGWKEEDVRKFNFSEDRILSFVTEVTRSKVLDFLVARSKVEYVELPEGVETK